MSTAFSRKDNSSSQRKHEAGAFDIRNVIGALIGLYGIVLVACYFFLDPGTDLETGVAKNASDNLWTGIGMLIVAAVFFIWAKVNPIIVDENVVAERDDSTVIAH